MPLFSETHYGAPKPLSLENHVPGLWESIRQSFSEALEYNPSTAFMNAPVLRGENFFADAFGSDLADADVVNEAVDNPDANRWRRQGLPIEEQQRIISEAGLEGQIKPGETYDREALDLLISSRKTRNARAAAGANAPAWHFPFTLASSFAAGLVDPVNIASAFIPVVGEQRLLSMLASARGAWGRAGVRAASGAASGAAGAAMLEPVIAASQKELQNDYTLASSLLNIGFGAAMGAAIAPAAGKVGEWLRARRGQINSFEFAPQSEESVNLMRGMAAEIAEIRQRANPALDPALARREAMANAMAWDKRMRHFAWAEKRAISDVYAEHGVELRNGEQFRQEAAALETERATLGQMLEEFRERRQMAADYPELNITMPDAEIMGLESRLSALDTRLALARSAAEKDWAQMVEGAALFQPAEAAPGGSHYQINGENEITAAYTPGENPVIRIFESHDAETIPFELARHMVISMEKIAKNANPLFLERWRKLEQRYGVDAERGWERGQQEAFARDFMGGFMIGHNEAAPQVAAMFPLMREHVLDLYEAADSIGLQISDEARQVFDSFLTMPALEGSNRFASAIADLNTRCWEREFVSEADLGPLARETGRYEASGHGAMERLESLAREAQDEYERLLRLCEQDKPELAARLREEAAREQAELDRQWRVVAEQEELVNDMVACFLMQ